MQAIDVATPEACKDWTGRNYSVLVVEFDAAQRRITDGNGRLRRLICWRHSKDNGMRGLAGEVAARRHDAVNRGEDRQNDTTRRRKIKESSSPSSQPLSSPQPGFWLSDTIHSDERCEAAEGRLVEHQQA